MSKTGPLVDRFGRVHTDLRISVTDRCNLRCVYCMREEGVAFRSHGEILRFEECSAEDLQESLQERFQYRIQKHVLSFEGVCSECQAFLEKKAHTVP